VPNNGHARHENTLLYEIETTSEWNWKDIRNADIKSLSLWIPWNLKG